MALGITLPVDRKNLSWQAQYDADLVSSPRQAVGAVMPADAFVVGLDLVDSAGLGLRPIAEALYRIDRSVAIDSWLPFRQARGDEIWGIVSDAHSLLALLRLMLVSDGRFRAGIGLGYTEVNSAFFPRDSGYELANIALNRRAKKSGRAVEVVAPIGYRDYARALGEELNALVTAWRNGADPALIAALESANQAAEAVTLTRTFWR